ncbi:hypothetical protein LXM94_21610 [Rhizobium sp. TRM95111]|uniref:hypothetical protein n=1 Tax=Rhizobium alarense TaxID=2846851 RepID=UPI001F15E9CF|nr:hypothetical protein [Rhizobium alarense]MCF3642572.1 hypothetical protein [Rhizobium alarense]
MVNLVALTSFRAVADDLKSRLLTWICKVEDRREPEIRDANPRFPRRYRLHASDLIGAADRERDIDPIA